MPISRFLTAEWRNLLMLNYEVEPGLLAPLVPRGTKLDSHDGRTYVTLVGFQFLDTRVLGIPIPMHRNFVEVNLRFYVRRTVRDEVRRGVVFIREIVPRRAIALMARVVYNEPYVARPMRAVVRGVPPVASYEWREGGHWRGLGGRAQGDSFVPEPASHEAFITEHYWGYTAQRDGGTIEYRVHHPRWRVWVAEADVSGDLAATYGGQMAEVLSQPASAFIAEGSGIQVDRPARVGQAEAAA